MHWYPVLYYILKIVHVKNIDCLHEMSVFVLGEGETNRFRLSKNVGKYGRPLTNYEQFSDQNYVKIII